MTSGESAFPTEALKEALTALELAIKSGGSTRAPFGYTVHVPGDVTTFVAAADRHADLATDKVGTGRMPLLKKILFRVCRPFLREQREYNKVVVAALGQLDDYVNELYTSAYKTYTAIAEREDKLRERVAELERELSALTKPDSSNTQLQ
jgi:hypothetical protein